MAEFAERIAERIKVALGSYDARSRSGIGARAVVASLSGLATGFAILGAGSRVAIGLVASWLAILAAFAIGPVALIAGTRLLSRYVPLARRRGGPAMRPAGIGDREVGIPEGTPSSQDLQSLLQRARENAEKLSDDFERTTELIASLREDVGQFNRKPVSGEGDRLRIWTTALTMSALASEQFGRPTLEGYVSIGLVWDETRRARLAAILSTDYPMPIAQHGFFGQLDVGPETFPVASFPQTTID